MAVAVPAMHVLLVIIARIMVWCHQTHTAARKAAIITITYALKTITARPVLWMSAG
jgi:hypothetical protein